MNTKLIEKALKNYLLTTEDVAEKEACIANLMELATVMDHDEYAETWNNCVYMIPASTWDDVLNNLTYDILGRRLHVHGTNMKPEYYFHDVRKKFLCFGNVPNEYLMLGYEVLSDLWRDNEAEGSHSPDGSFKADMQD